MLAFHIDVLGNLLGCLFSLSGEEEQTKNLTTVALMLLDLFGNDEAKPAFLPNIATKAYRRSNFVYANPLE